MNVDQLIQQVRQNCDISDAQHAGRYSVCGLAMRLRDLFKWEHRLPPWQEGDTAVVLEWIGRKEELWETLHNAVYGPWPFNGHSIDLFDTEAANSALSPHGLFLGAGYAHGLKPTFFLADILQKRTMDGHTVWQLGHEHARDLLTLPALSQDNQVVLRGEAGRMFLWDQMAYINKSGRWALSVALEACGVPDTQSATLRQHLEAIWKIQRLIYVQHEIGELEETVFGRDTWRRMLADFPQTPVELLVRGLKDMLADTGPNGALTDIIRREDKAALGLYVAFIGSFAKGLQRKLICAFEAFVRDGSWPLIADAAHGLRETVRQHTHEVLDRYHHGRQSNNLKEARRSIEERMKQWDLISS